MVQGTYSLLNYCDVAIIGLTLFRPFIELTLFRPFIELTLLRPFIELTFKANNTKMLNKRYFITCPPIVIQDKTLKINR